MADDAATLLPVQRQLEAYNARDIDAFMPWWAEDCEIYAFPDQLLARGAAAIASGMSPASGSRICSAG